MLAEAIVGVLVVAVVRVLVAAVGDFKLEVVVSLVGGTMEIDTTIIAMQKILNLYTSLQYTYLTIELEESYICDPICKNLEQSHIIKN